MLSRDDWCLCPRHSDTRGERTETRRQMERSWGRCARRRREPTCFRMRCRPPRRRHPAPAAVCRHPVPAAIPRLSVPAAVRPGPPLANGLRRPPRRAPACLPGRSAIREYPRTVLGYPQWYFDKHDPILVELLGPPRTKKLHKNVGNRRSVLSSTELAPGIPCHIGQKGLMSVLSSPQNGAYPRRLVQKSR